MTLHRLVVAAIALALGSAAHAQSGPAAGTTPTAGTIFDTGSQYMSVKIGPAIPQHDDLEGFNTGVASEVTFGSRFHPNFAGELNVGFAYSTTDTQTFDLGDGTFANAKGTAFFMPITGTMKVIAPLGNVDLYALGGLGAYFARLSVDAASSFARVSDSDSSTSLGFHFGVGTAIALSPKVSLGAELKYHIAKATFFDVEGNIDYLQVAGALAYRF
jgi:opacity protein-like surface antigen